MGSGLPQGNPAEDYAKGKLKLKFELEGEKLGGKWSLVRTHMEGKQEQWFLIKSNDSLARPESEYDIVKDKPDSVISDRTLIVKKRGAKAAEPKPVASPNKKTSKSKPKNTLPQWHGLARGAG
jgi:bifunctional non-homologous end joining protein LigD